MDKNTFENLTPINTNEFGKLNLDNIQNNVLYPKIVNTYLSNSQITAYENRLKEKDEIIEHIKTVNAILEKNNKHYWKKTLVISLLSSLLSFLIGNWCNMPIIQTIIEFFKHIFN